MLSHYLPYDYQLILLLFNRTLIGKVEKEMTTLQSILQRDLNRKYLILLTLNQKTLILKKETKN